MGTAGHLGKVAGTDIVVDHGPSPRGFRYGKKGEEKQATMNYTLGGAAIADDAAKQANRLNKPADNPNRTTRIITLLLIARSFVDHDDRRVVVPSLLAIRLLRRQVDPARGRVERSTAKPVR